MLARAKRLLPVLWFERMASCSRVCTCGDKIEDARKSRCTWLFLKNQNSHSISPNDCSARGKNEMQLQIAAGDGWGRSSGLGSPGSLR